MRGLCRACVCVVSVVRSMGGGGGGEGGKGACQFIRGEREGGRRGANGDRAIKGKKERPSNTTSRGGNDDKGSLMDGAGSVLVIAWMRVGGQEQQERELRRAGGMALCCETGAGGAAGLGARGLGLELGRGGERREGIT